jgi:hypothetical protein
MGHSAAESVVKAGLTLVPFTLTGYSAGVAVSNIGTNVAQTTEQTMCCYAADALAVPGS